MFNSKIKSIILCAAFATVSHFAFAAAPTSPFDFKSKLAGREVKMLSPRVKAMGNVGTALSTGFDSLYQNPANLAFDKGPTLDIVSADVNLYGLNTVLSDNNAKEALKEVLQGNVDYGKIAQIITPYLTNLKNTPVLTANIKLFGIKVKGFGVELFGRAEAMTRQDTNDYGDMTLAEAMQFGGTIGWGRKLLVLPKHTLAVGASASVYWDGYSYGVHLEDVVEGNIDVITKQPIMSGIAHPINFGVTYKYSDFLYVATAWTNAFNRYSMGYHDSFTLSLISDSKVKVGSAAGSWDIGIGLNPKFRILNPKFEFDVVKLNDFNREYSVNSLLEFLKFHTRFGVELNLLQIIQARAGIDQGRVSFGAELNLWPIILDVNYGWIETGRYVGDAPTDYLQVKVSIGWDRTK